jgi:acetyl-CoA acyltransferase
MQSFEKQMLRSIRSNQYLQQIDCCAIALGHPLGATGAMLTARLLNEMGRRPDSRYGSLLHSITKRIRFIQNQPF